MFRLALHWQILVGMLIGTILGLGLNLTASKSFVVVEQGLPGGWLSLQVNDSSRITEIEYVTESETTRRVIDPLGQVEGSVRSVEELRGIDSPAADMYLKHGQSTARRAGEWFRRIGGLFLRMLQMVAVPLIVTSLLTGIIGLGGAENVGRMFGRTMVYYLATSMLAILTGLVMVNLIRPGLTDVPNAVPHEIRTVDSLGQVLFAQLEAIIPSNPLSALVVPNYLSIIAFTIAFGIFTVRVGGATAERIQHFATAGFDVMMAMTMVRMERRRVMRRQSYE